MKRRDLLVGAACMAGMLPCALRAQRAGLRTIGVLVLGNPDPQPFLKVFRETLRELGYVEGLTIALDLKSAEGYAERLPDLAEILVRSNVDAIVAYQTPPAMAAKKATRTIPIVLAYVGDPVRTGLVDSLSHPGGNITGSSAQGTELAGKNVEIIRQLMPSARRIGVLANSVDPFTKPFLELIQAAARQWDFEIRPYMLHPSKDASETMAEMRADRVDLVIIQPSMLRPNTVELMIAHELPATSLVAEFPRSGGLMAYSASSYDLFRLPAVYVDKILKGAQPGDLPIQLAHRYELLINLKAARRLGLTVPTALLARADEVIE